jgi:hypothetical protein
MARERNEEERRAVLREWDFWIAQDSERAKVDPIAFFFYLQNDRSTLLEFDSRGNDKWQIIHGWLLRFGKVKK